MQLVTFGDSWPAGYGVQTPYGKILADRLDAHHVNLAERSTSNEHMLLQLIDYVKNYTVEDCTAIFFITSPHRCLFFDDGSPVEIYPWHDDTKGHQSHAYYKYLHSTEIEHFRLNQTILALQKICQEFKIKDYYFSGWHRLELDWPGITMDKIFNHGKTTAADWIGAKKSGDMIDWRDCSNIIPNDCHPNQQGHALIADFLYKWITKGS